MKLAINIILTLFTFCIISEKSYALSDYKIKKICKKEKNEFSCIKSFQEKKSILKKGKHIEIPVIPYQR